MSLECPCCGWVAAEGMCWDGQELLCGCEGTVYLDSETEPYISMGEDECSPPAKCKEAK